MVNMAIAFICAVCYLLGAGTACCCLLLGMKSTAPNKVPAVPVSAPGAPAETGESLSAGRLLREYLGGGDA